MCGIARNFDSIVIKNYMYLDYGPRTEKYKFKWNFEFKHECI